MKTASDHATLKIYTRNRLEKSKTTKLITLDTHHVETTYNKSVRYIYNFFKQRGCSDNTEHKITKLNVLVLIRNLDIDIKKAEVENNTVQIKILKYAQRHMRFVAHQDLQNDELYYLFD